MREGQDLCFLDLSGGKREGGRKGPPRCLGEEPVGIFPSCPLVCWPPVGREEGGTFVSGGVWLGEHCSAGGSKLRGREGFSPRGRAVRDLRWAKVSALGVGGGFHR